MEEKIANNSVASANTGLNLSEAIHSNSYKIPSQ
jgi:hypothetical protein